MLGLTDILRKIWLGREGSASSVGLVPERCQCLQGGAVVGAVGSGGGPVLMRRREMNQGGEQVMTVMRTERPLDLD